RLPERGAVFFSLADRDKPGGIVAARRFVELGLSIVATAGTAQALEDAGVPVEAVVAKVGEADDPGAGNVDAVELISSGKVQRVVNTPRGHGARADGAYIRRAANVNKVPCLTTVPAALAAAAGIADWARHGLDVRSLQEFHEGDQLRLRL